MYGLFRKDPGSIDDYTVYKTAGEAYERLIARYPAGEYEVRKLTEQEALERLWGIVSMIEQELLWLPIVDEADRLLIEKRVSSMRRQCDLLDAYLTTPYLF